MLRAGGAVWALSTQWMCSLAPARCKRAQSTEVCAGGELRTPLEHPAEGGVEDAGVTVQKSSLEVLWFQALRRGRGGVWSGKGNSGGRANSNAGRRRPRRPADS